MISGGSICFIEGFVSSFEYNKNGRGEVHGRCLGNRETLLLRLRLVLRSLFSRRQFLALVRDSRLRTELLVVLVLHDFADVNIASHEVQSVVGFCVRRKPV